MENNADFNDDDSAQHTIEPTQLGSTAIQTRGRLWYYVALELVPDIDLVVAVGFHCYKFGLSWPNVVVPCMLWAIVKSLCRVKSRTFGQSNLKHILGMLPSSATILVYTTLQMGPLLALKTTAYVLLASLVTAAAVVTLCYTNEEAATEEFVYSTKLRVINNSSRIHIEPENPSYVNIRLLHLRPRLPFCALKGSIREIDLGRSRGSGYEAISYTWGRQPSKTEKLIIDNMLFPCTGATYNALKNSTSWWRSRNVWIDAVCINQEDQVEKANQVACMRYIYSRASRVRVQIDPIDGSDTYRAASLIKKMAWFVHNEHPSTVMTDLFQLEESTWNRWNDVVDFFANPWFSRAWIIQEVVCGSPVDITYGNEHIDWYDITAMADFLLGSACFLLLHSHPRGIQAKNHAMAVLKIAYTKELHHKNFAYAPYMHTDPNLRAFFSVSLPSRVLPLSALLSIHSQSQTTDPRDKVYTLLGLVIDNERPHPRVWPDYGQDLGELINLTTEHIVAAKSYMDIISFVGKGYVTALDSDENMSVVKSWAANWVCPPLGLPLHSHRIPDFERIPYTAATHFRPELRILETGTLSIRGEILDQVKAVGPGETADDANVWSWANLIRSGPNRNVILSAERIKKLIDYHDKSLELVLTLENDSRSRYGSADDIRECFWRTLIGDYSEGKRPAIEDFGEFYQLWIDQLRFLASYPGTSIHSDVLTLFAVWFAQLENCAMGRKMCITNKGFMGMMPMGTRVGDLIVLFHGAAVPCVLRKVSDRGIEERDYTARLPEDTTTYEIIGECYVHGVMNGEAVGELQLSELFEIQ